VLGLVLCIHKEQGQPWDAQERGERGSTELGLTEEDTAVHSVQH
jgi:hypothetical protein